MTIGSELRQAREQQGLSLREISDRTKIRTAMLRAIEDDEFQHVPGGVITRGFLKLYAREVGLDPDAIARRYVAELEAKEVEAAGDPRGAADRGESGRGAVAEAISRITWAGRAGILGVLVVLVLFAAGYLQSRPTPPPGSAGDAGDRPAGEAAASIGAPSASNREAAPTEGTGTAGSSDATPGAAADVLRIDLLATGTCWIAATADGRQVAYRLMSPGERLAIRVSQEAVLRIGIPANLTVTIDDRPIRPFSRPGTPATLRITPANYRELLPQ